MTINNITLTIPTNWENDLLPVLADNNIGCVYGKVGGDFIGSGTILHDFDIKLSKNDITKYIEEIHKRGISFRYIIDAVCLDNMEWIRTGQKRIRNLFDSLVLFGVDSVSVSMPYLVELIKKHYPALGIEISLSAEVDNVQRAKRWENLGADVITLASYKINRNFVLLKEIRENIECELQLVANHSCLNSCINHAFHANVLSHGQEQSDNSPYFGLECFRQLFESKYGIIASQWIRPEDVGYYEEIGINRLQLQDANIDSKDITRIVEAYCKRSYEGNLADLFPRFFRSRFSKKNMMSNISFNNSGLNGFIKYFLEGRCQGLCSECSYCKDIADKTVHINEQAA